jgi:FkbM family methyltransferase
MMNRSMVRIARSIYRATPFPIVRQFYFGAFCRVMRDRQVRATIQGTSFELDLGEMIDVALYLEQYELDVAAALSRYCAPGMTALDIGANIGAHTLTMARLVAPGGSVHAFEPTDFAFAKLRRNVGLNDVPHVHLTQAAISDHSAAGQSIAYRSSWRTNGGRKDAVTTVDFIRLDDWAAEAGIDRVGLIKIDIDGNEFAALAGGQALIARSEPVIVIEAVGPHFAHAERNPFSLLAGLGYRFWDAKSEREYATVADLGRLFPPNDAAMTVSVNVVARVV